jgi:cold shock CspA family protein
MTGTIVLASKRGFYFVAADGTEEQYFLHASAVLNRVLLKAGDKINFDLDQHPQGRNKVRAVNAVRVSAADIVGDESYATKV